ncbi:MAG: hypothetical protein O2829_01250 [Bacteroidetes bacterium]|nr:hypothetical protein [Bacteroidota bacterium]
MKLKLLFFVLTLLLSLNSLAVDPEFYRLKIGAKRWQVAERSSFLEGRVSRKILNQLDSIYQNAPTAYEFNYEPSSQTLRVFVQCTFDFYSIKKGQLIKEYKFTNRGYTCGSFLFEKNNTYHLLSGRGIWTYHVDLMEFDTLNGSWEFVQSSYQPLDYYPLGTYQTSKGIVTIFGEYNNPRIPRLGKEANGFFLDLEKKSWRPIKIDIKDFDLAEIVHANESNLYETEDYAFSVTTSQLPSLGWYLWIIFEKETGKLFFYEGKKHGAMFDSPYYEYIGNTIHYFDFTLNSVTEGKEAMINLDIIRSQSREIGQVVVLDAPEKTGNASLLSLLPWIGFPVVFLLALWLGIQIQKRKNTAVQTPLDSDTETDVKQESEEENAEILQRLLLHNGKKLSTDEFDSLLGIHEITQFDSKRVKRARLIKEINFHYEEKKGNLLITRIRNPEDRRFVFYKISF